MASEKDTKKSMDISRPGKTPPDESSRPVVVSHRPMMQDPMMIKTDTKAPEEETPATKSIEPPSHSSKVIQPLNEQASEDDNKTPANTVEEIESTTKDEETKAPESSESAVVDAVVDQVGAGKKKGGGLSEADKAKQDALQKLITEKKYFLPIGHGHHSGKKSSPIALILLVLLVAAAGFYLAVDAGLIGSNIKLPIDIIKS
ncbi:MAG: hypothetical protein V4702_02025 [Patescibacteria group bacterium]